MIVVLNILQRVYALYYLVCALGVSLLVLGMAAIGVDIDFGVGVNELLLFMQETGFLLGLLGLNYFAASLLLMFNRTAPLGVVILAPAVLVIFFTHWVVEGGDPAWGTGNALVLLGFAWRYRKAYFPLFNFSSQS